MNNTPAGPGAALRSGSARARAALPCVSRASCRRRNPRPFGGRLMSRPDGGSQSVGAHPPSELRDAGPSPCV